MIEYGKVSDEVNALIFNAWQAGAADIVGIVPEMHWQGIEKREMPEGSQYWARVSIQTVFEQQSTLSDCVGTPYKKRYTVDALVFVQIFCPKSDASRFETGKQLAMLVRNSMRGKTTPGKIIFRNVRINEAGLEDLWERFNVVAEIEYDEIG